MNTLLRSLTLRDSLALVVGTIIGTGIFLKTAVMTQQVGSAYLVLLAWGVAGALSLAGALAYAELGELFPKAGGEFVYLREAYGDLPAFLYGWQRFWIGAPGSIAAYAVGAAAFLGAPAQLAFGFIAVFTALNCLAVSLGGWVQSLLTALKVLLVLGLIFGIFIYSGSGSFTYFAENSPAAASPPGALSEQRCWQRSGPSTAGIISPWRREK